MAQMSAGLTHHEAMRAIFERFFRRSPEHGYSWAEFEADALTILDAVLAAGTQRTAFEVRYDDEESYHVAARFTNEAGARRLRDRLAAAHAAADNDGCHLDSSWQAVQVQLDDVDAEGQLPDDLFDHAAYDVPGEEHADVNIDRLPLR